MRRKIIIYLFIAIFLFLAVATTAFCVRNRYQRIQHQEQEMKEAQAREAQKQKTQEFEKTLSSYAIHHLNIMKKAVDLYIKHTGDTPRFDIEINEILKLAETDLSHGEWDDILDVYNTKYFVYLGSCYSTWCYIQANRKNLSYSLYIKHDGQKWSHKRCATEHTEWGRFICDYLKSSGWEYVEGEI